jgi:hypothetical protein
MKKIILLLAMLSTLVMPSVTQAQRRLPYDARHEINLGYGYYTPTQVVSAVVWAFVATAVELSGDNAKFPHYYGIVSGSYGYHFNKWFTLRGTVGVDMSKFDFARGDGTPTGKLSFNSVKIGVEAEFDYLNAEWVKVYGYVGGVVSLNIASYYDQINNEKKPAIMFPLGSGQFTPVGLAVGKKFGAFAELGFGYNGIFRGGLYYKF